MTISAVRLPRHISLQTLAWCLLIAVGATTIALNTSELKSTLQVVQRARWEYLLILIAVRLVFAGNMGLFYFTTFRAGGARARRGRTVLISTAANFVNQVSKSSGLGGLVFYLRDAERDGNPRVQVTAAYMAAYVLSYVAYLCVLVVALLLLYVRGSLTTTETVAAAIVFTMVSTMGALLLAAFRSKQSLARLIRTLVTPVNGISSRLLHRPLVSAESLQAHVFEFRDTVQLMLLRRRQFLMPFLHALGLELLSVATLYLVAMALHVHLPLGLAVAGYALSMVSTILSVTPAGLGFVEASLAVFLASTGMTRHEAIAVTLGFRFFDFWLPVAMGALSVAYLRVPAKAKAA